MNSNDYETIGKDNTIASKYKINLFNVPREKPYSSLKT